MDRHIDTCARCSRRLREDGEIAAKLAYGVPQIEAPARVKRRLMSRIEPLAAGRPVEGTAFWPRLLADLGFRQGARAGMVVASIAVAVLVLGGVWVNGRLNEIVERKETLAAQAEELSDTNASLQVQTYLAYSEPAPSLAVKELSATRRSDTARGMFLVPSSGRSAIVAALGLPPLPKGFVYNVWLNIDGRWYSAASFTVDSTGHGDANIKLFTPLAEIDAIAVTIERVDGSKKVEKSTPATGSTVLRGDL